jgi:Holliday junction resolvase RusA-like endonuclease
METFYVTIPGIPVSKPRMTQRDKWKQRPCVMRYRAWADGVRAKVWKALGTLPASNRVHRLSWIAYFEPPKSWGKAKRAAAIGELHRAKPDRDNIDKALLDCLFDQDSGVAAGTIEKRWDWTPRLELVIELIDQPQTAKAAA